MAVTQTFEFHLLVTVVINTDCHRIGGSYHQNMELCLRLNPRWFIQKESSTERAISSHLPNWFGRHLMRECHLMVPSAMLRAVHSPPHCMPPTPPYPLPRWGRHSSKGLALLFLA